MASDDFSLPSLPMPDDWELDWCPKWGYLTYLLQTSAGEIRVESGGYNFYCTGHADALIEQGLVKWEWLPGLPGNNKVSQRVVFGENGPRLIGGNLRGESIPEKLITIRRKSRNRYCVEVPTTPDQEAVIRRWIEKWDIFRDRIGRQDSRPIAVQSEEYQKQTQETLLSTLGVLNAKLAGFLMDGSGDSKSPFCYSQEVRDEVIELSARIVECVKEAAPVIRKEWKSENAAQGDDRFQEFLAETIAQARVKPS